MKVHTVLGPGYVERIYENALLHELARHGLSAKQQVRYQVMYNGVLVGEHVLDLVIQELVYIELKCQRLSGLEEAQVLSGLKASGLKVGLLLNFAVEHLRQGIRRIVRTPGT